MDSWVGRKVERIFDGAVFTVLNEQQDEIETEEFMEYAGKGLQPGRFWHPKQQYRLLAAPPQADQPKDDRVDELLNSKELAKLARYLKLGVRFSGNEVAAVLRDHLEITRQQREERRLYGVHGFGAMRALSEIRNVIYRLRNDSEFVRCTLPIIKDESGSSYVDTDQLCSYILEVFGEYIPEFDNIWR